MIIGIKLNMVDYYHEEEGQEDSHDSHDLKKKYVFDDLALADMMLQF
jgi:hypothetical protein